MVSVVGGYSELIEVALAIEAANHRHAHLTHARSPQIEFGEGLKVLRGVNYILALGFEQSEVLLFHLVAVSFLVEGDVAEFFLGD